MNNKVVLSQLLKDAHTIIDVGAFCGAFTADALELYPEATVHAFEPNLKSYIALADRFEHDQRVIIDGIALGERAGKPYLNHYSAAYNDSLLSLDPRASQHVDKVMLELVGFEGVPMTTLDDYCLQAGITNIDILKIDTQGYDLNVLHGARHVLPYTKLVQVELIFVPLYLNQALPIEITYYLQVNHGMKLVAYGASAVDDQGFCKWCDAFFMREE